MYKLYCIVQLFTRLIFKSGFPRSVMQKRITGNLTTTRLMNAAITQRENSHIKQKFRLCVGRKKDFS